MTAGQQKGLETRIWAAADRIATALTNEEQSAAWSQAYLLRDLLYTDGVSYGELAGLVSTFERRVGIKPASSPKPAAVPAVVDQVIAAPVPAWFERVPAWGWAVIAAGAGLALYRLLGDAKRRGG